MKIERTKVGSRILDYDGSVVVIGDVHGHYKTLLALLAKLPENVLIVFVGDLINRGPQSREIVELVKSKNYLCVQGNHETMMVEDAHIYKTTGKFNHWGLWLRNYVGGWQTLKSYKFGESDYDGNPLFEKELFLKHADWMNNLPVYLEFPKVKNKHNKSLVVSHSSAAREWHNRNKPGWEWQFARSTMWAHLAKEARADFGLRNPKKIENVFNVFGHTPIPKGPKIGRHFAAIDTGIYHQGVSHLAAYQFPEGDVFIQEKIV